MYPIAINPIAIDKAATIASNVHIGVIPVPD